MNTHFISSTSDVHRIESQHPVCLAIEVLAKTSMTEESSLFEVEV